MTNSVVMLTVLATNWLPIQIQVPNGSGGADTRTQEIGIIVSNRYAKVVADGKTNQLLVSSQAVPPKQFLIRDVQVLTVPNFYTNRVFWNGGGPVNMTNGRWIPARLPETLEVP